MNPRVASVVPNDDYTLTLHFMNGEEKQFDVRPLLQHGIFTRLKDISLFRQARITYGTVEWPDDIDICPDTLYENGTMISVNR